MRIAGLYSFNDGEAEVRTHHAALLQEVESVIAQIDANEHKTKISSEKTMAGQLLFSPSALNKEFKRLFAEQDWVSVRVSCEYPTAYYVPGYQPRELNAGAFREMDFVKDNLGIEVQFGKYSFMVYNVCAKMTIFHNLGHITHGIEIVPVKAFADEMSSGGSYFEQFVWDLESRGVSDNGTYFMPASNNLRFGDNFGSH